MQTLRQWSPRHSPLLARIYRATRALIEATDPIWRRIGHGRLERPAAFLESWTKGVLFDCQMCGQCVLSSTGMSCPMNCPKQMRNGPCGGVRSNGHCEVRPEMPCVWVAAWDGSARIEGDAALADYLEPTDHRRWGTSAWLHILRDKAKAKASHE